MKIVQQLDTFRLPPNFRGRSAFFVQSWWLVQATLFACSPQFMYGWRRWLLKLFGAKIGQDVLVRPSVKVTYPWKVSIGDYAWIGDDAVLYSLGEIEIGAGTVVSQRTYLCAASHDYAQSDFPIYDKKVCIGAQAWLATDVFVAPGVTIGEGAVVGARSSVFHDLPPMMVCVGSPAKPIKPRMSNI
ncbi:MAG: putative colanic acid biosynthesis acetyltransferase [Gallionella sp.]